MSGSSVPPPPTGPVPPVPPNQPVQPTAPQPVGPYAAVSTQTVTADGVATEPPPLGLRGTRTRRRELREYTARERVRVIIRGIGEVLITVGLVLLLFCAYQIYWTDFTSERASAAQLDQLEETFAATPPPPVSKKIPPLGKLAEGEAFARMYIPRFGENWVRPVIQGVTQEDLHKGVGHYPKSALPGQKGNFAVAGHRTTNGHPFRKADQLEVGDTIYVETKFAWYTYTVTESRLIVKPSDVYVVAPVPEKGREAEKPTERLLTLTTCHPPYSAAERMITHAKLAGVRARGLGPPPGAPGAAPA